MLSECCFFSKKKENECQKTKFSQGLTRAGVCVPVCACTGRGPSPLRVFLQNCPNICAKHGIIRLTIQAEMNGLTLYMHSWTRSFRMWCHSVLSYLSLPVPFSRITLPKHSQRRDTVDIFIMMLGKHDCQSTGFLKGLLGCSVWVSEQPTIET